MTLKTFKTIKAATQLIGSAAGVYAMYLGGDPVLVFGMLVIIISGPESLEYFINQSGSDADS